MDQNEQLNRIEEKIDFLIKLLESTPEKRQEEDEAMLNQIILVKRSTTKNSGSPMWRCVTFSGHQVNVFAHTDPDKNNFNLIVDAGYDDEFLNMEVDTEKSFTRFPINIKMRKNGKWWELVSVDKKSDNAMSDKSELDTIKKQFNDAGF